MKRNLFLFVLLLATTILTACGGVNVTINFDTDGGTEIESINTDGSSSINIPNNPEKEGFVFDGWYWDEGTFLRPFTANSLLDEPISGDLTVYAKWLPESLLTTNFEVIFDTQGGSAVDTQTVLFRDTLSEPNEPTRLGYLFAGWFKDRNHTEEWNFITGKVENNMTLYAKWNVISEDYHIVHFVSNFDVDVPSQQVLKGSAITAPNISREGYTLEGWYTSLNNGTTLDEKWSFTSNVVNSNFTLYAKWTINQYTISFESNGGSLVNSITRDYGTSINQPQNPFKSGYMFGGWYTDQSLETPIDFDTMPAANMTLYAEWLRTLNFETNGAATINSITFRPGENLIQPNTPSKIGHTFAGWYSNITLTTPFTFGSMPDQNVTLYAKWTVNSYTISFEMNGGNLINDLTLTYDQTILITSEITKIGHTFIGWYTDASLTSLFTLTIMPAQNFTLYAKWEINSYTISFETNSGSTISPITQVYDTVLTAPEDPTKEGHTFAGWYADDTFITPYVFSTVPAADTVLYAKWTVNTYTLSYVTNTDSSLGTQVISYGVVIPIEHNLTKDGYAFAGWYTDQAFEIPLSFDMMPAFDLTLYAKWSRSITFMSNGGSDVESMIFDPGVDITLPDDPTRIGYTFAGWYIDEALMNPFVISVMPDDNLMLYAKWEINQYTISFNSDGGSVVSSITQDFESTVTVPNQPEKEGYSFIGWTSDQEGTMDYIFDIMPASDLTLYAQWKINSYAITFDTGDGTAVDSITQDYQTELTEPADPTRLFYTFDGWYEDQEYSTLYTFNLMEARNLRLYAKWLPDLFIITLELNGGTGDTTLTERYTLPIEAPLPEKEGYTFDGWFTDSALTNPYVFSTMPPQNFTLYAKWNINAYTITFETYGGKTYNPIIKIYNTSMPVIEDPIKEGYTFTGWFLDESFEEVYSYSNMPAKDITLYARWYNSIIFDSSGGSVVETITLPAGDTVLKPSNPVKLGHTFVDWYEDKELTIPYVFSTMPEPNITIYAKWDVNQYIIGFEPNGGDYVETITQDFGTKLILPTPVRTGYSFIGWYKDTELSQAVDFTTVQASNMVLYAQWEIITYMIIYELDGGIDPNNPGTYQIITPTFDLYPTSKEGYTFLGWYDNPEFLGQDITSINLGSIGSLIIYAKYSINQYTITYYSITEEYNPNTHIPLYPDEVIIQFESGYSHSVVLTNHGRVYAWGGGTSVGNGRVTPTSSPDNITQYFNLNDDEKIIEIYVAGSYSFAKTTIGRIFAWGVNNYGQLGDGTTTNRSVPVDITNRFNLVESEEIIYISAHHVHTIALTSFGRILIWGSNTLMTGTYGVLGTGTNAAYVAIPTDITNNFTFDTDDYPIKVFAGASFSALLTQLGKVYTWGNGGWGRLGNGTTNSSFTPIDITNNFGLLSADKVINLSLGFEHAMALTSTGRIFSWGYNEFGQLGIGSSGTYSYRSTPVEITNRFSLLSEELVVDLSLGNSHSGVLTSLGNVYVWGYNYHGQLGDNSTASVVSPKNINEYFNLSQGENITELKLNINNSYSITSTGQIYVWGSNDSKHIFTDRTSNVIVPTMINISVLNIETHLTLDFETTIEPLNAQNGNQYLVDWFSDIKLTNIYEFTLMPSRNLVIFSKWETLE